MQLINDILDLSKIEANKIELYNENVNLVNLLSEVESIFRLKIENKGIGFIYPFEAMIVTLAIGGVMSLEHNCELLSRTIAAIEDL
jgi:signal transduction histidine kinase